MNSGLSWSYGLLERFRFLSSLYDSLRLWLPLSLLSCGDVLSLRLARSSPSAHSVAILSRAATVFGFSRPRNSWKSRRETPCTKASITMSSDVVLTEFRISVHRLMYARSVSSGFCMQDLNSSNVFGLTARGSKFLMKSRLNSSQERSEERRVGKEC